MFPPYLTDKTIRHQVRDALEEDIGDGDLTARLIDASEPGRAEIVCREPAVLCGTAWVEEAFRQFDDTVTITWHAADGERLHAGHYLCTLSGPARSLLTVERTALNFLQTLSGTATLTRHYVDAVAGTDVKILDTRKTLPGLRLAQKYAVLCGGGHNHRIGLFDAILIKENHILAAGSIGEAVRQARTLSRRGILLEVEVETLHELHEALAAGVDRILLDNMDDETLREAVAVTNGRAELEASGGVTLETVRSVAETGVDYISVGELTKNLSAIDLSMRFMNEAS